MNDTLHKMDELTETMSTADLYETYLLVRGTEDPSEKLVEAYLLERLAQRPEFMAAATAARRAQEAR